MSLIVPRDLNLRESPPRYLLPAIMRERLVLFRHLLHIFPALDRRSDAVAGVEQFAGQTLGHGLFPALAGVTDAPADRQRGGPAGPHFDRHLIGGATHPAALHLELRADVFDRA